MKYALRKTPSHLHVAYKYGEGTDGLMGRNFHTRSKAASAYLDAVNFAHNHHKLRYLQCADNLVRARLIKAWEQVTEPKLVMCLEMGPRGHYRFVVEPHSLFMGGIQFDVKEVLEEEDTGRGRARVPELHGSRHL